MNWGVIFVKQDFGINKYNTGSRFQASNRTKTFKGVDKMLIKDEVEGKQCRVELHEQARHLFMTGEISEKHYRMVL